MIYAVLFEDNDGRAAIRGEHLPDHLAFLERNASVVRAAGPLAEGGTAAGGLWLVQAECPEAVCRLIEADPFWPTGLRKSVRIMEWRQVFADGRRLI